MPELLLLHGDCLDLLSTIPEGSVDAVIADPPYGTTACSWDSVIPFVPMWRLLHRVTKETSPIALFSTQPFTSALVMSNAREFRYEWIWEKTRPGNFPHAKNRPLSIHEHIAIFSRGVVAHAGKSTRRMPYFPQGTTAINVTHTQSLASRVSLSALGMRPSLRSSYRRTATGYPSTVLHFANPNHASLHETQKPVELLAYLIRTYTTPGATILDFCMGSGSTGVAALAEGRGFIGIERDHAIFRVASERILAAQQATT